MIDVERLARIPGLISEEVGLHLATLATAVPFGQAIVEIGAYKGKSTCYLAAGAREGSKAPVFSVDPWDSPGNEGGRHGYDRESVREAWQANVSEAGFTNVTQVQAFSLDAAADWAFGPIGLLYVDGSHLYSDVKADFEAWFPHLANQATVAFDDYRTKKNPGVTQYVDELRTEPMWFMWDLGTPPLAIGLLR